MQTPKGNTALSRDERPIKALWWIAEPGGCSAVTVQYRSA